MKRFTETTKWEDPWFRSLTPKTKLLWLWLVDHCDIAGVIRPDLELASFQIGEPVNEQNIRELQDRVNPISDGKLHIPKFVTFQFGTLSEKSNVHRSVMKAIALHGQSLTNPGPTLGQPLVKACSTPKEKEKVQVKEKEKEKEKGVQGEENFSGLDPVFIRDLMSAYRRTNNRLTYSEESSLAEIIREHPRYRDEWDVIITLKQKEPRYFPQSLSRLLSSWQETLDRAMNWTPIPNGKTMMSLVDKELERIRNAPIP